MKFEVEISEETLLKFKEKLEDVDDGIEYSENWKVEVFEQFFLQFLGKEELDVREEIEIKLIEGNVDTLIIQFKDKEANNEIYILDDIEKIVFKKVD